MSGCSRAMTLQPLFRYTAGMCRELISSTLLVCYSRKSMLTCRFQEFDDLFAHRLIANSLVGLHVVARDDLVRILDESVEIRFVPGDPGAGEALRIVAVACRSPCLRAVDVMKGWAEAIVAFLGRMTSSAMSVECQLTFVRGKNVPCADECEQGGQPGGARNDTDRGNHEWLLSEEHVIGSEPLLGSE